jgi:hypothetical protein
MILHYDGLFATVLFVDSPATKIATFFEVPKNKSPSSFRCCKCAANSADFFCAPRSLQCHVEVVPSSVIIIQVPDPYNVPLK